MINHQVHHHKFRTFSVLVLLSLWAGALTGCGGDKAEPDQAQTAAHCQASLDVSGWHAFTALGDRLLAGQDVPRTDLEAYALEPAVVVWRESMLTLSPTPTKLGNWVEGAFWNEKSGDRKQKLDADRYQYAESLRLSYDHRERINQLLEKFGQEGVCQTLELARFWVDPEKMPSPFSVTLLPTKPELRSHAGQLIADTGMLLAGGGPQLGRQIVGVLYRDVQAQQGKSPLDVEGATSIAQTVRVLMNEGTAAWIEDMPHTYFDPVHPRLGNVELIPETFYDRGRRAIEILNGALPRLLVDEDLMASRGREVSRSLLASGAMTKGGYCLAATIVHHLGEERLRAVSRSPRDFLMAYQEAALQNPQPLPTPGAIGVPLPETMPPLDPDAYQGLASILEQTFAK
jgi:hypothetical protein